MKEYLGDSVYAEWNGYDITLTTENGYAASNTIVMEPQVLEALDAFLLRVRTEVTRQSEGKGAK